MAIYSNWDWKIWLVVGILFLIVIYVVYEKWSAAQAAKKSAANYNAAVGQTQQALDQLASVGTHPSYGQADYTGMANALAATFSGCGMDWEGIVIPTFQKMKNDADVYALIQNYGVQTIKECGWGSFTGDLSATLGYKTSGVILNPSINPFTTYTLKQINDVLTQNGLTYAFV